MFETKDTHRERRNSIPAGYLLASTCTPGMNAQIIVILKKEQEQSFLAEFCVYGYLYKTKSYLIMSPEILITKWCQEYLTTVVLSSKPHF